MTSLSYSIPYLLLFFLFLLLDWICSRGAGEREKAFARYSAVALYVIFFGFRGFIGADWNNYYPFYNELPSLFSGQFGTSDNLFEPGFVLFSTICKTISSNYHFFILINALVNVLLLDIFIRRHLNDRQYVLGIMIFLLMGGIINEIDLLRASKAVLLFMISIKYIQSRKLFKFLLINAIGLSFHSTTLLFLPLYFIVNRKFSIKPILLIWIIGNAIFLLQVEYIKPVLTFLASIFGASYSLMLSMYLDSDVFNTAYGFSLGFIERTFSFVVLAFFHNRLYTQGIYSKIFINIFYIFIFCNLIFGEFYILQARVGLMLSFTYMIIWPMVYRAVQKKLLRQTLSLVFGLYVIFKTISYTGSVIYRYDNVLTGIESFVDRSIIYDASNMDILYEKRGE